MVCKENNYSKCKCKKTTNTFDWVIAGGGTSACVLARLLTDNFETSVFMVEAGRNNDADPNVQIPTNENPLTAALEPIYGWSQISIGQPQLNNATFPYQNARMLGGSSNHNGMQWVRPTNY